MKILLDVNSEWILIEKIDEKQDIYGFNMTSYILLISCKGKILTIQW